jgi:hypothetical protein
MPALKYVSRFGQWKELAASMPPGGSVVIPTFPAAHSLRCSIHRLGYRASVCRVDPNLPGYRVTLLP